MTSLPIGFSTGCFYYKSIFECLDIVRDRGFQSIEICSFPDHLDFHDTEAVAAAADAVRNAGLEPVSLHAPFSEDIDFASSDTSVREHSFSETRRAVHAAGELGVNFCVLHPGSDEPFPDKGTHLECMQRTRDMMGRIADTFREQSVRILLENMLPHLRFGNPEDMLWIMGALGNSNIGVCLDTGHAALSGSLAAAVYTYAPYTALVHINDNNGEHDDHLPPEKGNIDWQAFLSVLNKTEFRGHLILELAGDPERDPAEIMNEAAEARSGLNGIMEGM